MTSKLTPRLLVGSDRGLLATSFAAAVSVLAFAMVLKRYVPEDTWTHDFFFRRSFVQWVLLVAFTIGVVHLVRRLPAYWREKRALNQATASAATLVGRRRQHLQAAMGDEWRHVSLGDYARSLAEHDEAELDGAYRLSGDIIQVLPLIGFFGTVFGLSSGLYSSFLAEGGTTTKAFAKAIAIAFDNTLLGLALTIILFGFQSVLRKRDEACLLQLNLQAADAITALVMPSPKPPRERDPLEIAIEGLKGGIKDVETTLKELRLPADGMQELVKTYITEVAQAVLNSIAEKHAVEYERLAGIATATLRERDEEVLRRLSDAIRPLGTFSDLALGEVRSVQAGIRDLAEAAESIGRRVSGLAANAARPVLAELLAEVKRLDRAQVRRADVIANLLNDIGLSLAASIAAWDAATKHALSALDAKLQAVPEVHGKVDGLSAHVERVDAALAERHSEILTCLRDALRAQSERLTNEIRQPRTIRFVEATNPAQDGHSE